MAATACDNDFEIIANKNAKSSVWNHFGYVKENSKLDKKRVACRKCRFVLKHSGNTTNLSDHLRRKHDVVLAKTFDTVTDEDRPCFSSSSSSTRQLKLSEACSKNTKLPSHSKRTKDISSAILQFMIKDLRPFSVVQNSGFRNLVHCLEPRYTIPSRQYFSDSALPALYDKVKTEVKADLKEAEFVSLTTDGWTSRATESYVTITSSHIDPNWEIKNYVLQTRVMPESHTGTNIAQVLTQAVDEWGLKSADSLVTDNAANMSVAAKEAGFEMHLGCFAHTLNLACGRALKLASVSKLLAKMRRIVAFFHRSTTAAALLKQKQDLLSLPKHKLITDCPTRWNSAVDMTERYLEQQPAIIAALTAKDLRGKANETCLSDLDLTNAEELITVLSPLKTATVALCEEKVPTLSIVLPLQLQLVNSILSVKEDDTSLVKQVKSAVSEDLCHRYGDVRPQLVQATILDLRFKTAPFLSDEEKLTCFQTMTLDATKLYQEKLNSDVAIKSEPTDEPELPTIPTDMATSELDIDSDVSEVPTKVQKVEHEDNNSEITPQIQNTTCAMTNFFGDVFIVKTEEAKPIIQRVEEEVTRYKKVEPIPLTQNPLIWWRENAFQYPALSLLAKRYLAIPATSVPAERVFSTAGDIVSAQRSTLKSDHVDRLLFLKKNWKN